MKRKTQKNKYDRLFRKYSKNKQFLLKKEIIRLMKKEFKVVYSPNVCFSLMSIWGEKRGNNTVITKVKFPKLFRKPDGFFRDISL